MCMHAELQRVHMYKKQNKANQPPFLTKVVGT